MIHKIPPKTPILQDPLSIFGDCYEIAETYHFFRYQFFVDFHELCTSYEITAEKFSSPAKTMIEKNYTRNIGTFPTISEFLYGKPPHAFWQKSLHLYEHCLMRALHTVQYLLYTCNPEKLSLSEGQLKNSRLLNQKGEPTYIPGYLERKYINEHADKYKMVTQGQSASASSYVYWAKQFENKNFPLPDYFLFTFGRLSYKDAEKIPVLFPCYNQKFYNHIQNNQKRVWQGVTSKAFTSVPTKLTGDRIESIISIMRKICSSPAAYHYSDYKIDVDIPNEHIWLDDLLVQYQCERFYNMHLVKYMIDNKPENMKLSGDDLWLSFISLPNIFSRHNIVQLTYDIYQNQDMYDSDLYEPITMDNVNKGLSFGSISNRFPVRNQTDANAIWTHVVLNSNRYLSRVVFPFYEKLFFLLVYYLCAEKENIDFNNCKEILQEMESFLCKEYTESRDIIEKDTLAFLPEEITHPFDVTETSEKKYQYLSAINSLFNNSELDLDDLFHIKYSPEYFGAGKKYSPITKLDDKPTNSSFYQVLIAKEKYRAILFANDSEWYSKNTPT